MTRGEWAAKTSNVLTVQPTADGKFVAKASDGDVEWTGTGDTVNEAVEAAFDEFDCKLVTRTYLKSVGFVLKNGGLWHRDDIGDFGYSLQTMSWAVKFSATTGLHRMIAVSKTRSEFEVVAAHLKALNDTIPEDAEQ